jgi:predicted lipoprotein with Yx(FWY)xxD motif
MEMKMKKLLLAGGLTLSVFVAGCGGDSRDKAKAPKPAGSAYGAVAVSTPTTGEGMVVALGQTKYGKALTSKTDQALYLFEKDKRNKSSCYGTCAKAWPPYVTDGQVRAGSGVKADLLGTLKRDDGKTQIAYNGHPLYYYIKDRSPGDATGQDLEDHGAEWYLVGANGQKVPGHG